MASSVASEILTPRKLDAQSLHSTSSKGPPSRPRFDVLRLREWFNQMDQDRCGHVTRQQFRHFLGFQPHLRSLIVEGQVCRFGKDEDGRREEARQWRRLTKVWHEIDDDKNGTLEWEEFVEFFRKWDMLIEYQTKDNPKERLAEMLATMHENPDEQATEDLEEFMQLRSNHLHGERRRSLGTQEAADALDALDSLDSFSVVAGKSAEPANADTQKRRNSFGRIVAPNTELPQSSQQSVLADAETKPRTTRSRG